MKLNPSKFTKSLHFGKLAPLLFSLLFLAAVAPASAAGTYSEGWLLVKKINKLESGGIIFDSWEGEFTVTWYDEKEEGRAKNGCIEKKYQCFTPKNRIERFSVRPDSKKVVDFLRKNKEGSNFLVKFRYHRFEPFGLSTNLEITDVMERTAAPAAGLATKKTVRKTGSRHFWFQGEILMLEYKGVLVGTYEGIYLDRKTGKVHPFSVTDPAMAKHAYKAMTTSQPLNIGISVAIVTGLRESDHDLFEITLAGHQDKPAADPKPAKP